MSGISPILCRTDRGQPRAALPVLDFSLVGSAWYAARWPLAARPSLRAHPLLVTTDDDKPTTADDDFSAIDLARRWWDETADFAAAFNIPKLEEDTLPAAVALHTALEASKESPSDSDFGELAKLTGDYYGACSERTFADPRVAERLPTVFNLLNGVLVLALLVRLAVRASFSIAPSRAAGAADAATGAAAKVEGPIGTLMQALGALRAQILAGIGQLACYAFGNETRQAL